MSDLFALSFCRDSGNCADCVVFDDLETAHNFLLSRGGGLVHPDKKEGSGTAWIVKIPVSGLPPVLLGSYCLDGVEVLPISESTEIVKRRYPVGARVELPGVLGEHFPQAVIESVDEIASLGGDYYLAVGVDLDPAQERVDRVIYRHDKIKVRPLLPTD